MKRLRVHLRHLPRVSKLVSCKSGVTSVWKKLLWRWRRHVRPKPGDRTAPQSTWQILNCKNILKQIVKIHMSCGIFCGIYEAKTYGTPNYLHAERKTLSFGNHVRSASLSVRLETWSFLYYPSFRCLGRPKGRGKWGSLPTILYLIFITI
jgi:hypothetical protein